MKFFIVCATLAAASACEDSTSWYKTGDETKDCSWVGQYLPYRCATRGDGEMALTACAKTCSTCGVDVGGRIREPPLPGVLPGVEKPKIILAQYVDYPPYASLDPTSLELSGFGSAFALGMGEHCGLDVTVVESEWDQCWTDGKIGQGLLNGHYHGCMTYTHTIGVRNRYVEFSYAILDENKPAGILTRLGDTGAPIIGPDSNLDGVNVIDVVGWAPTPDGLALTRNPCTGELFSGYNIIEPSSTTTLANDDALRALLDGEGDAIYIYSDQVDAYTCAEGETQEWDCDLWSGLGTEFGYVHTGLTGHEFNGTTLTIAKKGAGLAHMVNPCIASYMRTEAYHQNCVDFDLVADCYPNEFFPEDEIIGRAGYNLPTTEQTGGCASGYCDCSATP